MEGVTIEVCEGDELFWGSGERSSARAYKLTAALHEAFVKQGGLQQFGLQGEDMSSDLKNEFDEGQRELEKTACDIFEALTGLRLRIVRENPA